MSKSWASFAATGDPNNANCQYRWHSSLDFTQSFVVLDTTKLYWPKYSDGQQELVFRTQGSAVGTDVS